MRTVLPFLTATAILAAAAPASAQWGGGWDDPWGDPAPFCEQPTLSTCNPLRYRSGGECYGEWGFYCAGLVCQQPTASQCRDRDFRDRCGSQSDSACASVLANDFQGGWNATSAPTEPVMQPATIDKRTSADDTV